MPQPIQIFIAYAREDADYLAELHKHLRPLERNNTIDMWYDGEIAPGSVWEQEVKNALHRADIILLLVSANALGSDSFYEREMKDALARDQKQEAIVLPIILNSCAWDITPLQHLRVLPKDALPINKWESPSDAYTDIVHGINKCIQTIQQRRRQQTNQVDADEVEQNSLPMETQAQGQVHQLPKSSQKHREYAQQQPLQRRNDPELDNQQNEQNQLIQEVNIKQTVLLKKAGMGMSGLLLLCLLVWGIKDMVSGQSDTYTTRNGKGAADSSQTLAQIPVSSFSQDTLQSQPPLSADPFADQMKSIQGGTFWMGSPNSEAERQSDEYYHQVTVGSFKMSQYEVTQAQWEAVMGSNPSHFSTCPQCPVESISWHDVQIFLQKLNAQTGKNYRLPTEIEWEYAARGGTITPFNTGNCLSIAQANYDGRHPYQNCDKGQYRKKTAPVGSFAANQYGLYDMHGNVWEWCSNWYDEYDHKNSSSGNTEEIRNSVKVRRGGSWRDNQDFCRSAYRGSEYPNNSDNQLGFRLAAQ